jgi:hypothetical protein
MDAAEAWLRANDPNYLKHKQGWKHLARMNHKGALDYNSPFEEIALSPVTGIDPEDGKSCPSDLENVIHTSAVMGFDYQREYEKKPDRKKDRHKGSRAAYMREYRARRKSA